MLRLLSRKQTLLAAALILAGAVWLLRDSRRGPNAVPPELPPGIADTAVADALAESRARVVTEPASGFAWGELGLDFRAYGFEEESNRCFVEASRFDSENPAWPYLIGLSRLQGRPEDAEQWLERAYRLAKTPAHVSAARLRLAELHLSLGRREQAEELFGAELRIDPSSARAHYGLASTALERNDPAATVEHLKHAEFSPHCRKNIAALFAAAYGRLDRPDDASRYAKAAAGPYQKDFWPDPFVQAYMARGAGRTVLVNRAQGLADMGQVDEAVAALELAAEKYPEPHVLRAYGEALMRQGNLDLAEQVLRRVIAMDETAVEARAKLGNVQLAQGERLRGKVGNEEARSRYEAARETLRQVTRLKPGHGPAHLDLARVHYRLSDPRAAEASCRESLLANPSDFTAHMVLGEILLEAKRPTEALAAFEQAARIAPDPAPALAAIQRAKDAAKKP